MSLRRWFISEKALVKSDDTDDDLSRLDLAPLLLPAGRASSSAPSFPVNKGLTSFASVFRTLAFRVQPIRWFLISLTAFYLPTDPK
ncbi:hypothetical protein Hanom_Chr06g00573311 [Helianthus anomalus]